MEITQSDFVSLGKTCILLRKAYGGWLPRKYIVDLMIEAILADGVLAVRIIQSEDVSFQKEILANLFTALMDNRSERRFLLEGIFRSIEIHPDLKVEFQTYLDLIESNK